MTANTNTKDNAAVDLQTVYEIPMSISAVVGKAEMPVSKIVRLSRGSVFELDKKVGEPVDLHINDRLVARGEIVLIDGEKIGITITEMVKSE